MRSSVLPQTSPHESPANNTTHSVKVSLFFLTLSILLQRSPGYMVSEDTFMLDSTAAKGKNLIITPYQVDVKPDCQQLAIF